MNFSMRDYGKAIDGLLRFMLVLVILVVISVPVALYYVIPDIWSRLQPMIHEWTKEG